MVTSPVAAAGVIVIGGSAGSMGQVENILAQLPARLAVPVVFILHRGMDVRAGAALAHRLGRVGRLEVVEVEDLTIYQPDQVYLAPPGYHTLIGRSGPTLSSEPRQSYSIPSIDSAFESAADAFGSAATVVALSCANIDGLTGARHVLAAGGRVLAVDPALVSQPVLVRALSSDSRVEFTDPLGLAAMIAETTGGG
jgi:two-component system chemotaxis response regulator CheB